MLAGFKGQEPCVDGGEPPCWATDCGDVRYATDGNRPEPKTYKVAFPTPEEQWESDSPQKDNAMPELSLGASFVLLFLSTWAFIGHIHLDAQCREAKARDLRRR